MFGASTTFSDPQGLRARVWDRLSDIVYRDPAYDYSVVITTPGLRPDLWQQFLTGSRETYELHGVESVLDYHRIKDGSSTSMFMVAVDPEGTVLGGVRVQGPLVDAGDSHAEVEFEDDDLARTALRRMISDRLHDGVVEMKNGWVSQSRSHTGVALLFGQAPAVSGSLLGSRYALCTGAQHVANMHQGAGAVVASHITPVAYPDDRYQTRVYWWDLQFLEGVARTDQYARIVNALDAVLLGTGPFATEQGK